LGHLAGDQALVNLGLLIRRHVRAADVPARIGGDEFAVILDGADLSEASIIAERMRDSVSQGEFVAAARTHSLGLSGGLAAITAGVDAKSVMSRADTALYAAKAAGRDRMVVWDSALGEQGAASHYLQNMIEGAFESDSFTLMYQPVVRLTDGSVAFYESLVRMRAADGTVYGPAEFLPHVEGAGRMSELTRRTVKSVLAELASVPGCSVSVNLSGSDLADRSLLEALETIIRQAGSVGRRLVFELSEDTLMAALPQGRAWMRRLGELGCSFVLDDFGTGVGMFSLLREDMIEQVKLSRLVVRALSADDGMHAFVIALRELVESQGKEAVATFVESEQSLGEVVRAGFRVGQGYGLHAPAPDLRRLVEAFTPKGE
jgi:predicted signal transduction protein with EAL and GGDEF domain